MRQPTNDQFRAEIDRQSALFRTALTGCDEAARVPACPDWAALLHAHLDGERDEVSRETLRSILEGTGGHAL